MAEESAQEAGTDIRRKAVVRLGIAAVVTLLALAALWWLEQSGKEKPKAKSAAPSPIVAAPTPTPPAPPEPAEPEALPEEAPPAEPPTAETPSQPTEPPPPPRPGVLPKPPAAAPASPVKNEPVRPAAVTPRPVPTTPAALPQTVPPAPAAKPGDFVVQLGVFSSPVNAQQLVDRLKQQGIRAYTETRVHVGPFLNKAEAEKAQAELKRLGLSGIVDATR